MRELAACKTLADYVAVEAPQTSICPFCFKISNEIRFLTSLKGRAAYDSREPLGRVRPIGVVPPAIRVPAEAVALRLDERRVLQIRPAQAIVVGQ